MTRSRLVPLGLSVLVSALSAVRVALVYDRLPARMASHFGLGGRANGFAPKASFLATLLCLHGAVLLLFVALPALLKRTPNGFINLPHRDYWLAPARREATVEVLATVLAWVGLCTVTLLAGLLEQTLRASLDGTERLHTGMMLGVLGYVVMTLGVSAWMAHRFRAPPES